MTDMTNARKVPRTAAKPQLHALSQLIMRVATDVMPYSHGCASMPNAVRTATFPRRQAKIQKIANLLYLFMPLIIFSVDDCRLLSNQENGAEEIWMANVEANRSGVWSKIFQDVLFIESNGTVFISGIESEDGYPEEFDPVVGVRQQFFIDFLRAETKNDNAALESESRSSSQLAEARDYLTELLATAAYVKARGKALNIGIGYRDAEGTYQLIAIETKPPTGQ
jgi:hypothetical protein